MHLARFCELPRALALAGMFLALTLPLGLAHAAPFNGASLEAATDSWDALLKGYVKADGRVDYLGLDAARPALDRFLKTYATLDLTAADDLTKKAAYINFYNAGMMSHLLRYAHEAALAVASAGFLDLLINEIKTPGGTIWNGDYTLMVSGHTVTLDDVEHNLLRGKATGDLAPFKVTVLDPRLHAAVNCAARSCPRVREVAYRSGTVDRMLADNMREFLGSDRQFHKISDDKMQANQIVYWYYEDFDDEGKRTGLGGAGDYLASFLPPTAPDAAWKSQHFKASFNDRSKLSLKLSSAYAFAYDWRINDVRGKP